MSRDGEIENYEGIGIRRIGKLGRGLKKWGKYREGGNRYKWKIRKMRVICGEVLKN